MSCEESLPHDWHSKGLLHEIERERRRERKKNRVTRTSRSRHQDPRDSQSARKERSARLMKIFIRRVPATHTHIQREKKSLPKPCFAEGYGCRLSHDSGRELKAPAVLLPSLRVCFSSLANPCICSCFRRRSRHAGSSSWCRLLSAWIQSAAFNGCSLYAV